VAGRNTRLVLLGEELTDEFPPAVLADLVEMALK